MEGGLVSPVDEGTPQGGPLSPLLSNLVPDDLDKELERRGHRFCRYADDCVPERTDGRRCDAVQEMRVGPSEPAVRSRLQTAASCDGRTGGWRGSGARSGSRARVLMAHSISASS